MKVNPILKQVLLAGTVLTGAFAVGDTAQAVPWGGTFGASGICPNLTVPGPADGGRGTSTGTAADCNLFINFNSNGSISTTGPGGGYEGIEDALIGVRNNTDSTISSFNIRGVGANPTIFGFDNDGIDTYISNHITLVPSNPDTSGYGGPAAFFTNITSGLTQGTVNFAGSIAPGATAFFSLEQPISLNQAPIITMPEPASMALLGAGLAGFGLLRRRRRRD